MSHDRLLNSIESRDAPATNDVRGGWDAKVFQLLDHSRREGNAIAFLSSLIVHVVLLLVLACIAYHAGKKSDGLLLVAEQGESYDTRLDLVQSFEMSAPSQNDLEPVLEVDPVEATLDVELDESFDQPNSQLTGLAASLASLTMGDVASSLDAGGGGRGASFFGTYAEGNRFIYVLDSSRSMTGDRWVYACNQLIDSLKALKEGQEFFVICFDFETNFLFNLTPSQLTYFSADDSTITRVRRWLRARKLGSDTRPANALRVALEFNPDAIFLLSDGELQDNTLGMLRRINGPYSVSRQIPIHSIHLFSPVGRYSLERIAMENQGTFTHIDQHN